MARAKKVQAGETSESFDVVMLDGSTQKASLVNEQIFVNCSPVYKLEDGRYEYIN